MSTSVDVYIGYAGYGTGLAYQVATVLQVGGYVEAPEFWAYTFDTHPWIGAEGWAQVSLNPTGLLLDGPPGDFPGTALAPYEYELVIELAGVSGRMRGELLERLGRAVFDRLVTLNLPLALARDGSAIFADYLPGRGVRELPTETSITAAGRDHWFEERLHGDAAAEWPEPPEISEMPPPAEGSVEVLDCEGRLLIIPTRPSGPRRGEPRGPAVSLHRRVDQQVVRLPMLLAHALNQSVATVPAGADEGADPYAWAPKVTELSADALSRAAVSVKVDIDGDSDGDGAVLVPYGPYEGDQVDRVTKGEALTELRHTLPAGDYTELAHTVLDLLDQAPIATAGGKQSITIVQATQARLEDLNIGFASVFDGVAAFQVSGTTLEWQVVKTSVGETVRVGSYDLTLDELTESGDRDVAHITVAPH